MGRHVRGYDRQQTREDPDHLTALIEQREDALQQRVPLRFLGISPRAPAD